MSLSCEPYSSLGFDLMIIFMKVVVVMLRLKILLCFPLIFRVATSPFQAWASTEQIYISVVGSQKLPLLQLLLLL